MKCQSVIAIFAALVATSFAMDQPSFHTKGTPTGKPTDPLKSSEYWWKLGLSPRGPVVVLVRLPQRTMHVYRNGILIGRSSISSGSTGNSTPPDVFNIFDNKETHYLKTYNDAPMQNMQRLTWSGIAMQSAQLRGYPARDGCIRLPYDFSALLFDATSKGRTVVIGDGRTPQPPLASNPGLMLAPKDLRPAMLRPLSN
jgi:L,D-transpeptidase catalytic domain